MLELTSNRQNQINKKLEEIAEKISISDTKYEDAKRSYEAVGTWLADENSFLRNFSPNIYVQGSFALGTAIKPIMDDEYDVDVVCLLQLTKTKVSQEQLKRLVGDRLKAHNKYNQILEEKRRCWTLNYADSSKFHLDILPAIPSLSQTLDMETYRNFVFYNEILITDKDKDNYCYISDNWQKSNPLDYAEWFKERMYTREEKQKLFEIRNSIKDLPIYRRKTVLQKVIQLLKYHRNQKYGNNEHKPISIIITTLAAKAYDGEDNIFEAMKNIVQKMPEFIEKRNGEDWIPNPVDTAENFADKWKEQPIKKEIFKNWLISLRTIISDLLKSDSDYSNILESAYGISFDSKVDYSTNSSCQMNSKYMSNPLYSPFNLSYREKLNIPEELQFKLPITATFKNPHTGKIHSYNSNEAALPKNGTIQFRVDVNEYILQGAKMIFQVVNTGDEAKIAKDLRGGFIDSFNNKTKIHTETTRYKGRHMIQAFLIKNGICIARSDEFIVNIM